MKENNISLNLYEMNKNIIKQLPPLTPLEVFSKKDLFEHYIETTDNIHYMLLCRDYNYYTIFNNNVSLFKEEFKNFSDAVCTIITELGEVYSIELVEGNSIEIWIKPTGEEEVYAFYLFPYDLGVIYYG